jgi:hemerythrin
MSPMTWCEDYSVYIRSIDNEHKLLMEHINNLETTLETQEQVRSQIIPPLLKSLLQHIRLHFESEERFLLLNNYPNFIDHQAKHTHLLTKLENFTNNISTGKLVFTEQMLLFLKDWFLRHIILQDKQFGCYFRENNHN